MTTPDSVQSSDSHITDTEVGITSRDRESKIRDIAKDEINRFVKKWIVGVLGVGSVLAVYAYWQIYTSAIKRSEEFVYNQITAQFDEARVRQTLTEVAEGRAKKIIENRLAPAIDSAVDTVNKKISSFDKKINSLEDKYDEKIANMSEEISDLNFRSNVFKKMDLAISGSAKAYNDLNDIYENEKNIDRKNAALLGLLLTKSFYITGTRVKTLKITYTDGRTGKVFNQEDIPTQALILGVLGALRITDQTLPGRYRAVAAKQLGERKQKGVPEALLHAMNNDENLGVRKFALESFQKITKFESADVFGFDPAAKWWNENKIEVEKTLEEQEKIEEKTKNDKSDKSPHGP